MMDITGKINFNLLHGVEYKVEHIDYSAFGKILSIKDGNANDVTDAPPVAQSFTYTGREYDSETGLYYYRARSYDPNIGRFLQADPAAGVLSLPITHINKYVYVGNNPTNRIDPSGRSFLGEVGGFFGGRGGWATDAITAAPVVGVLWYAGGATCAAFAGAAEAVASVAVGAALASAALAAFQEGSFRQNFNGMLTSTF